MSAFFNPSAREIRTIPHAVLEHLRLRFPKGDAALHYNVLQKLTYLIVVFVLLPLMGVLAVALTLKASKTPVETGAVLETSTGVL